MSSSVLRRANLAFPPLAIALSVSAAFSPLSFAQTPADQSLTPVLVTASRTAQKAGDVLSDNLVISAEEIQQSGQSSLIDLLQRKRGIEIARNGGAGSSSTLYMRGSSGKQVVLLIDGVRSVSATTGEPSWSSIPLSQIDRIEVVFGPMSSMYGADAVGGVIQVFTKKGAGAPRVTASAGAGTYGTKEYSLGVAGSTDGDHKIRYSFNASQEEATGFNATVPLVGSGYSKDKDGYAKNSISGQLAWELAKGQELGASFLQSHGNSQYDSGSPAYDARSIGDVGVYSVYSRNQITSNWGSFFQVSKAYDKQNSYTSTGTSSINSDSTLVSWQNDIKIGTDLLQVITEHRKEAAVTNLPIDRERTTKSLALAYQLQRGAHLGSISTRYDDNSTYGSNVTGSLGYGYHISKVLRVSGSIGTSFRAPTFNELYYTGYGNPNVQPEKGKNAEVGIYYDDGKSDFSVAFYRNRVTNMIITQRPCSMTGIGSCAYNVNEALLTGLSVGGGRRIGDFRLYGSLDLQDPKDKTKNTLLERRARYHGTLGVDYVNEKFSAGADIGFSGSRFSNSENTQPLGGYALLNLNATYNLSNDWQLFARWNNVLDKDYVLARGYNTPGSNGLLGVRYGFK
ncbi:TonB-dependent receptor plug domain-containing protein [Herminiimonas glaciei]|uniref:TonB-dependent receptor plug domain-containing protein n=1 Tax=Herminiimonas glaciei TaxID=523788 RepID=A0ABW2IAX8_9BURK